MKQKKEFNAAKETRMQNRLAKLGTNEPRCGICGETDWRVMDLHHVADHKRDELTVLLCANCHRKVTDDQRDHPPLDRDAEPMLDRIGHFMLGLADMLRLIVEKLIQFGNYLIERAALEGKAGAA